MNVLELFCGTKSVGKVCNKLGWSSVSVDIDKKFNPTHIIDIMNFDYKQYSKDYFDIVWSSPPCCSYSILQGSWIGRHKRVNGELKLFTEEQRQEDMNKADKIIMKTLDIINYFNCEYWFMENPSTGKLKDREIMKDIPFYNVDYCKYSDWGYKKPTRIWTNKKNWKNLLCYKDCENMNGNIHKARLCNKQVRTNFTKTEKYRIPEKLILSLFLD